MTVNNNNNIVTPVSSLDEDIPAAGAAAAATCLTAPGENNKNEWYYSKLLHGQNLSALDVERLKDSRQSIPLLDRSLAGKSSLQQQQQSFMLVRIRGGFVQDMFASEYFETSSSNNNNNNTTSMPNKNNNPTFAERTPILITPIPFSTQWFRNVLSEKQVKHRNKRARENNNNNSSKDDNNDEPSSSSSSSWWDAETMQSDPEQTPVLAQFYYDQYHWATAAAAHQSSSTSSSSSSSSPDHNNKVRLNDIVEMIGILENHDDDDGNDIDQDDMEMACDTHTGAGMMMDVDEGAFWDEDDTATTTMPPRHIPRLHVLWFDLLDFDTIAAQGLCQNSIVLSKQEHSEHNNGNDNNNNNNDTTTASQLLASALEMDQLSATALYLNLLSMAERQPNKNDNVDGGPRNIVTKTTPSGATLGCSSLHLMLPNNESCCRFQQDLETVLSQIVPAITSIHINGGNSLSTKHLALPSKKQGRIQPTLLQLPQGSTLIINTSSSSSSSSSSNNNVAITDPSMSQALEMLTMNHHLPYQFDGGMTIPFEADVRVIVLSSAASSDSSNQHQPKLPSCTIQAKCCFQSNHEHAIVDNNKNNNPHRRLSEEQATFLRQCLTRARGGSCNNNNIGMPSAVLDRAQNDFIQRRTAFREREQQQGSSGTVDTTQSSSSSHRHLPDEMDFHRWLTVTRLLARQGRGNTIAVGADLDNVVATIQDWERALALDDALMDSVMN